jgi:hypothetical protein
MDEPGQGRLRLGGANQSFGGVHVDAACESSVAVDRRRDDRGEVDDGGRRYLCDEALDLFGISKVCPPILDAGRQLLGRLAVGGCVEVGGNNPASVGGQPLDRCFTDQAEASGDQHTACHSSSYLRI